MDRLSPKSKSPGRTLNIPKNESSPTRKFFEHPESSTLDQLMLYYLDMDEILKGYSKDHRFYEKQSSLDILAQRFELPRASTFKELLKSYDAKYATVRSYHYKNVNPKDIMLRAAQEGEA